MNPTPPALRRLTSRLRQGFGAASPPSALLRLSAVVRRPIPALLACVALACAGCAKRETPVEAGLRTGTLLVGNFDEPRDLDPQNILTLAEANLMLALFEGLTGLDEATGRPVPGVAESWEMSPDGLGWTFHLRRHARWSNGDPVTARDFVFSYQRMLSPNFAAPLASQLWPIRNARSYSEGKLSDFNAVGVAARDEVTLELSLAAPCPWLLHLAANFTWFPVHRATLEKFGSMDAKGTAWTRPGNHVGNGPFRLVEWVPHHRVVMERSPTHWGAAQNKLQRVVFRPIENPMTEELAFRSGELHVTASLPPDKIAAYRKSAPDQLRIDPQIGAVFLNFNVTRPPLDQPKLRQALARAVDREAITSRILRGAGTVARVYVPPTVSGYQSPLSIPDDFAAAARLLAETGYPGGRGLRPLQLHTRQDPIHGAIAEALQEMWRRHLGVVLTIAKVDDKTIIENERSHSFDLQTARWIGDYLDANTFLEPLLTGDPQNWPGWSNREFDALAAEAQRTLDRDRRLALQQKAEAILLEAAPIVPLYFTTNSFLIHPAVRGWVPSVMWARRYQTIELR